MAAEQRVNTDPVAVPTAGQKIPVISGDRIAWMDKRDGNWDIYEAHDATAPLISSLTPGGTITTSSTTVTAIYSESGTGLNTASVALTLDGVPLAGCTISDTRTDCPTGVLAQGAHSVGVSLGDYAGNSATAASDFSVDSIAPTIASIAPDGYLTSEDTNITATLNDATSGINTASVSARSTVRPWLAAPRPPRASAARPLVFRRERIASASVL